MDRCDRQLVSLDNLLNTPNSHPSGTNLRPLVTALPLSTARRVQVFLRAWLSMPPPTAMRTTVQIVTTAVTHNRRTDKTHRCTSRVIRNSLPIQKPTPSIICSRTMRDEVYQKRTRLYRCPEQASLDESPYGGSLRLCRELMRRIHHLSSRVVLAFSLGGGGGCMFLVDGVYDGDYLSHHAQHGYGSMIDTAKESVQCSEDTTGDVVKTNAWAYVMHSASHVFLFTSFIVMDQRHSKIPWFRQFSFGVRTIACESAFETRNNYSISPSISSPLVTALFFAIVLTLRLFALRVILCT